MPEPDVAVVGPGAIGATVAACLHDAGTAVRLCGRTARPELVVVTDGGARTTVPGPVDTDPGRVRDPVGTVFLAVKATQVEASAAWLERLCGEGTVVCVLQNGVEQVERVTPHAGRARVLPSVVWFPAEAGSGGEVRLRGTPRLTLPAGDPGRAVAGVLDGSACEVELSEDFATPAWRKLCQNAAAGLMVLARRRAGMFRGEDVAALTRAYVEECAAVGRAEGADLPRGVGGEIVAEFRAMPADLGSSILFDHEAGRPLEWDIRNGVVPRRAARHGLATPISDVVVPLLAAASA